jgi:lysophospholipase-3
MAGVWGGTVRAMKVFAIGDNLGAWIISSRSLMIEQRTNPSLAWLMPNEDLWPDTEVLLQSPKVNITTKNMQEFFEGLGHPEAELMRKDVKDLIRPMTPPGVETFCLHGTGVPTTQKYESPCSLPAKSCIPSYF